MNESGFLVVLPGQIMEIPLDSNLSWLRMFYALPRELVEKRPEFLDLPYPEYIWGSNSQTIGVHFYYSAVNDITFTYYPYFEGDE